MGALKKTKTEGGSGGKRGHSNMDHWAYTDEVKEAARTQRRMGDKKATQDGINELASKRAPSRKTKVRS